MEHNVKPMPGTLWCDKRSTPRVSIEVAGLGNVEVSGVSDGGIILPFTDTRGDINVRTTMVVVDRVGDDPYEWRVGKRNYRTTFAEQGITSGVVVATRAGAGLDQNRQKDAINIKYNEVVCIGATDDDGPPMYPAPGWVLCRVLAGTLPGALVIDAAHADVLSLGQTVRMQVIAVPRGEYPCDLAIGDVVHMSRFQAQDFVEFENNTYRCVPQDDILAVENDDA
jgi:co-chaperonin GroES (HSP10)